MKKILSLLLPFIILLYTGCVKKGCDFPGDYDFQADATLTPALRTYKIGDTISIKTNFSNNVFDRSTGNSFILDDWSFFITSNIVKIDETPFVEKVGDHFELIADEENVVIAFGENNRQVITCRFKYQDATYSLEFKFVAQTTGLFHFKFGFTPDDNQSFDGICKNKSRSNSGFMLLNNGEESNIDLLHESPDTLYTARLLSNPEERFHRFGGHVFSVEE